jgi:hypothetical protein
MGGHFPGVGWEKGMNHMLQKSLVDATKFGNN